MQSARQQRRSESVAGSRLVGSPQWEILVIDNNSNDNTPIIVKDACRRYPDRFRYLSETRPGKSNALNTGIKHARGSVLAFMDDDVVVDPDWLSNITAPLMHGDCAGAGGRVLLERGVILPGWVPLKERYALAPLAVFDLGSNRHWLSEAPVGTNMAFRREVFDRYGRFRTDLGPQPGSEIRGEDSEFANRLMNAGERILYEPSAIVYHSVPTTRLRKSYFLNWWFDKGRGDLLESPIADSVRWSVRGVPLVWFRRIALWTLRWFLAVGQSRRFSARLRVSYLAGQITEGWRQQVWL